MAEREEFGAFLIGFIIGGLAGAATALLLAPQSGEDTRGYLKDQAIVLRDKAQETAQTTAEQVGAKATEVRSKAGELATKAKSSAETLAQRGQSVLEEGKTRITASIKGASVPEEETPI